MYITLIKRTFTIVILTALVVCTASSQNKQRVDGYVAKGVTWLSDRLQMHWNTHATQQFMRGEAYSHCGGDSAAVPTLQINGARSHATAYVRPALEELRPRQEDKKGMYLRNKNLEGKPHEWVPIAQTGNIIGSINLEIASLALDAAKLYDRTSDTRYAETACSVLITYMLGVLHTNMPKDLNNGHMQTLYGLQTQEVIHEDALPKLCEMYRLLRDYINTNENAITTVLPKGALRQHKSLEEALDAAFKHWADIIEANGVPHNNWDLMQARFIFNVGQVLKPNSAYADGKGQEHYFEIVETGKSIRQWSLKALTEYGYDHNNGIWCECPGYSQVVLGDLAAFVRLYREQLGRDLMAQLPIIEKAARANVEYLFPDSMTIGFGDTHPSQLRKDIYTTLGIDFTSLHPSRTFAAPKTSWLIQRTGMKKDQSMAFALNASDGNHMHANGISMELFGRGLRLGPDAGIGYTLYSGDDYKEYYSQFPAHNTVCVDGVSGYTVMRSFHPFDIVCNKEPQTVKGDKDKQYQYSIVNFIEPETQSDQQRMVMMVSHKDDNGDGYFVDIFRSRRRNRKDKFHDYFYHNMGQQMTLNTLGGGKQEWKPTQELAFAGGHLYAYSYIYNKVAMKTADNALATYSVNNDSIMMRQWIKGSNDRMLVKALSPSTEGMSRMKGMPYNIRETPTLTFVARQYGEAWKRPFVCVFEPSSEERKGTIESVSYPEVTILDKQTESAVAVLVRHNDGKQELIVSTDNENARVKVMGKTYRGRVTIEQNELDLD